MKKSIDWRKLREDEKAKGVSVYILAKREMGYRINSFKDAGRCCSNCERSYDIKYSDCNLIQCEWLGIIKDKSANVELDHICNFHKRVYGKNLKQKEC